MLIGLFISLLQSITTAESTVIPPIAAWGVYFVSELSDPALIGDSALIEDGVFHVKDPALIVFSELSDPALIGGFGGY